VPLVPFETKPSDASRLENAGDFKEAGTEALVLVNLASALEQTMVSALWAVDDGEGVLAERFLLAALELLR